MKMAREKTELREVEKTKMNKGQKDEKAKSKRRKGKGVQS